MVRVSKSVTIKRPPEAVYEFWRQLENLPRFMHHLQEVRSTGNGRSHWIAKAPAGQQVEWDAEIVDERPGELIVWRALPGSDIQHEGSVHFRPAPADRGTEVEVALQYDAPGGKAGALVATLFGEEPSQQIRRRSAAVQAGHGNGRSRAVGWQPRRCRAGPAQAARCAGAGNGGGTMKATCWMGKQSVEVRDVPDPKILNQRDAIVRITSTAICGSDLHLYNGFVQPMKKGDILGHEFMGEVMEVGRAVKNLKVGDRVVVPFTIACGECWQCRHDNWSLCENSNPNAALAEKALGHATSGAFGYSHLTGGFAGGQAEFARVPFADVGTAEDRERLLGRAGAVSLRHSADRLHGRGDVRHPARRHDRRLGLWPCRPVCDQERVSAGRRARDWHRPVRLSPGDGAREVRRRDVNYETVDSVSETLIEMTAGRGPDACIDAVGLEAHGHGMEYAIDRTKQALMLESDRPIALREAIMACRNGGTISVIGVYGGLVDTFPLGAIMNRALTIKSGQCHVHRYMRPLLERIENGEIDPTMVITHRLPLRDAAKGYEIFLNKEDRCEKVVLSPR